MSTLRATNIKHESSATNQIVLGADGSIGGTLGDTLAAKGDISGETWTGTHDFTGATVTGAGALTLVATATPSAVSSVSIDSCFTATYDDYLIRMEWTQTAATTRVGLKLRASSTDATTGYYWQEVTSSGSSVYATGATNGSYLAVSQGDTGRNMFDVVLSSPARAIQTGYVTRSATSENTGRVFYTASGQHSATTSYDGLTIAPVSGTLTGTLYVYGYSKG